MVAARVDACSELQLLALRIATRTLRAIDAAQDFEIVRLLY